MDSACLWPRSLGEREEVIGDGGVCPRFMKYKKPGTDASVPNQRSSNRCVAGLNSIRWTRFTTPEATSFRIDSRLACHSGQQYQSGVATILAGKSMNGRSTANRSAHCQKKIGSEVPEFTTTTASLAYRPVPNSSRSWREYVDDSFHTGSHCLVRIAN